MAETRIETKKTYQSPIVTRIRLDARQAVLAQCSTVSTNKIGGGSSCKTKSGCKGPSDNTANS